MVQSVLVVYVFVEFRFFLDFNFLLSCMGLGSLELRLSFRLFFLPFLFFLLYFLVVDKIHIKSTETFVSY